MITAIALLWGMGIVIGCSLMWGSQHACIDAQTKREIEILNLEAATWDRNHRA
jgi:hypothetical protein